MGQFLTNIVLRGPIQGDVAAFLASSGRSAFVSPTVNGCTIVFDEASESQDLDTLMEAAEMLSTKLNCPALATLVHDSDVLILICYDSGRLVMDYNSAPDYFGGGEDEPSGPAGADPEALCRVFGSRKVDEVRSALELRGTFAEEALAKIVDALGLPPAAANTSFSQIQEAESDPEMMRAGGTGFEISSLRRTP